MSYTEQIDIFVSKIEQCISVKPREGFENAAQTKKQDAQNDQITKQPAEPAEPAEPAAEPKDDDLMQVDNDKEIDQADADKEANNESSTDQSAFAEEKPLEETSSVLPSASAREENDATTKSTETPENNEKTDLNEAETQLTELFGPEDSEPPSSVPEEKLENIQEFVKEEDYHKLLLILTELCDVVEIFNSSQQDYPYYLKKTVPLYCKIISQFIPVSFQSNSLEHKLRNITIEILNRSILTENLEPYVVQILELFLNQVLSKDNEENAVIAIKYVTSLFKNYKALLINHVDQFIKIIMTVYNNAPELVEKTFPMTNGTTDLNALPNSSPAEEMMSTDGKALGSSNTTTTTSSNTTLKETEMKTYNQALWSFKVLAECPLCMVTLFSSYKNLVATVSPQYIPLIIKLLTLQAEPQKLAREQSESRTPSKRFYSIALQILNNNKRQEYCDFIASQVKATSFLAYVFIRGHVADFLQNYVKLVPELIVRLLQDLPSEMSHLRKELLHATRHILSTNYKKLFLPQLDFLFDENVLLSDGFTNHENLRTLAYSMVADFIHNVRSELNLDYIEKTIMIYSKHLMDDSLQLTVQIMSAKLLLNLMERIIKLGKENIQDAPRARKLLMLITECYVNRLKWSNLKYENIMYYHENYVESKLHKNQQQQLLSKTKNKETDDFLSSIIKKDPILLKREEEEAEAEKTKNDENLKNKKSEHSGNSKELHIDQFDIVAKAPIVLQAPPPVPVDPLKDILYLYKTLLSFLKTIIHDLRIFNQNPQEFTSPANNKLWLSMSRIFSFEEVKVFKLLFHETLKGLLFFTNTEDVKALKERCAKTKYFDITYPNLPVSASKESKELMDYFVVIFMQIDTPTFNEVVESEMEFMYECMLKDSAILHVAQSFLTSEVTSPNFNGILLRFLKTRLPNLGNVDVNKSNILIRLYKLSFMSVNLYPLTNESVLLPYINNLILDSLKYSATNHEPLIYYYLIRTLFRSIGGGKFENLYRSIIPILESLLKTLNRLIFSSRRPHERDLYVELCLTVPVRLSALAPYFNYLMKPLVYALDGFPDLITQGLRTLELCVDTFTAEYLGPLLEPVFGDIMKSLYKLLKPLPYAYPISHTAVRILGKLGGKNRKFLKPPSDLETRHAMNVEIKANFEISGMLNTDIETFEGPSNQVPISVTSCVAEAIHIFHDTTAKTHYRVKAYSYLMAILKLHLNTAGGTSENVDISSTFEHDLSKNIRKAISFLASSHDNDKMPQFDTSADQLTKNDVYDKFNNQQALIVKLLEVLIIAQSIDEISVESKSFFSKLVDHFAVIYLNMEINEKMANATGLNSSESNVCLFLPCNVLLSALSSGLSCYLEEPKKYCVQMVQKVYNTSKILYTFTDNENHQSTIMHDYSLLPKMFEHFIHECYNEQFYNKSGAVLGIQTILGCLENENNHSKIVQSFLKRYQVALINALLFVLKDVPNECPAAITETSAALLIKIMQLTCSDYEHMKKQETSLDEDNDVQMTEEDTNDEKKTAGTSAFDFFKQDKVLQDSITQFVCDLSSANVKTAEVCREVLQCVSDQTGLELVQLMDHSKSFLLSPIFSKPLRALPFSMQIGNINAIYYCLSLRNTFLSFDDELVRFLHEAVVLVDADDESLASRHRLDEYVVSQQLIQLRISCIKLLSEALNHEAYAHLQQGNVRIKIVAVFFKAMLKPSDEIIDTTYEGLKLIFKDQSFKLPKELLQNGLKPMLMNLSDHEKLTVHGMKALSRVLELLIAHFKVEIGKKLLDHLDSWCKIDVLDRMFGKDITDELPTKVIISIVNVFYLLPPQADMFLGDLVLKVMLLEKKMRLQLDSPFRKPLAKFLNRFHHTTLQYFLKNLQSRPLVHFICSIVCLDESNDLYADFSANIDQFLSFYISSISTNPTRCVSFFSNSIDIFETMVNREGDSWLLKNKSTLMKLKNMSALVKQTIRSNNIYIDHTQLNQATGTLQTQYLRYLELTLDDNSNSQLLIEFVEFLGDVEIPIIPFFKKFIYEKVVASDNCSLKTSYLYHSLQYVSKHMENETSFYLLKNIVNMILIYEGSVQKSLRGLFPDKTNQTPNNITQVKNEWLPIVVDSFWKNTTLFASNIVPSSLDFLKFELIQLTACIVRWAPEVVEGHKKDVVKFGWSFIKLSDPLCKQAAYTLISYFIAGVAVPTQIVTQIFVALLRSHQVEGRYMIKQALDLLAPVMYSKMKDANTSKMWVKWVRRVLSEGNHNQNITIYRFLTKYVDEFYDDRDYFIPNIISYVGKLVFQNNPSVENQVLAIDLVELILKWERKHRAKIQETLTKEPTQNVPLLTSDHDTTEDKMDIDEENSIKVEDGSDGKHASENGNSINDEMEVEGEDTHALGTVKNSAETEFEANVHSHTYEVPLPQREACVTFLIRYYAAISHKNLDKELGQRTLDILAELISENYWSEVNVQLEFFEKFLNFEDLSSSNILCYCLNALNVLAVVLQQKRPLWIVANVAGLSKLLKKCIRSEHQDIQRSLQKVVGIILRAIVVCKVPLSSEDESPAKDFVNELVIVISEDLNGSTTIAAGVMLTWSLFMHCSNKIDSLLPVLMKTFSKLCSDHLATAQAKDSAAIEEAKITAKFLEHIFYVLSNKIGLLGDSRRPFLSLIAMLIDRSMDQDFLRQVIRVCRSWTFGTDVFPTAKEKAAILTKMLSFELRGEPTLSKDFYSIVLDLFESKDYLNSEITIRLEHPFLVGTRISDVETRTRLMKILNDSLESDIHERLYYIIRDQNWEYIGEYPWLNQALQLLFGAFNSYQQIKLQKGEFTLPTLGSLYDTVNRLDVALPPSTGVITSLDDLLQEEKHFVQVDLRVSTNDILEPLVEIFYQNPKAIFGAWVSLFPVAYKTVRRNEKFGFVRSLVSLLSKDYHVRQKRSPMNVISAILEGITKVESLDLPPHLVKYLATTHNAWYESLNILETLQQSNTVDITKINDANEDALLEMYISLEETDMFYGLWRRRAKYTETNMALSYEQIGLWDRAQNMYEAAQVKARSGALPYSESEYALWEDDWVLCAQQLQQWDILTELAKHEGFTDLLVECGWRVANWTTERSALEQSVKSIMDVPTPRRQMFDAFLALQKFAETKKGEQDVRKLCDEGIQLSLSKWASLPARFTSAHGGLLHMFQIYTEFMEAVVVYNSLGQTTAENLEGRAHEVKRVLQCWRERLPNNWDNLNIWNDLVTWRQHVFSNINDKYLPLLPQIQKNNNNKSASTNAYKGYHEIAWVINRFAHVARKHHITDVCINQLSRIYTLPNIEIQEAFLKLREQAKCHYQNMNELTTGLDVISNTNLVYFGTVQKAEFFTLKGMFLSKLRAFEEANQAFATAVQIDLNLAKAWAQWGYFNDRRLSENPENISFANNALSCYLQAAGLYKNAKTRKLLCRVLWLIGIDDKSGSLQAAFDSFRGEVPVWYWITFIPQLLTSLSHKEANMVRQILIRIAKSYPQALHFQLRTTKEDFAVIQRQTLAALNNNGTGSTSVNGTETNSDATAHLSAGAPNVSSPASAGKLPSSGEPTTNESATRQPWEYLDELNGILKTAYPLLALSLELLVDQICNKFKSNSDEDLFRLINILLNDATANFNRLPHPAVNATLPPNTVANLSKFSLTLLPAEIRPSFNADFIDSKPTFEIYIKRLREWRNRLESKLDRAPKTQEIEKVFPHLSSFHHQKFEEIEIPGQYLLNKESNSHFIKIERFLPDVEFVRGSQNCFRCLSIRGDDGSLHTFAVQRPSLRHSRREERIFQLFRFFNETLTKNVETRRRNMKFTLPVAVPLSPQVRIMKYNKDFITLHEIYDKYCAKVGLDKDAIQDFSSAQLMAAHDKDLPKPDLVAVRVEIFSAIQSTFLPNTVVKDYFTGLFDKFEDFWLFRKQFSFQYASMCFMSYMLSINNRTPHKIHIDVKSGNVFTLETVPSRYQFERVKPNLKNFNFDLPPDAPVFHNNETVPFRLTPNIQKLIGETALEGLFAVGILVIARALLEPEQEMNTYLSLFVRDEVISWYSNLQRSITEDPKLLYIVNCNNEIVCRKVAQLGHVSSTPSVATQYILDAISAAVTPRNLANADMSFMPYL
ncbi:hypothetical protein ACO0QE_000660 [Hanseniaspora vineae]